MAIIDQIRKDRITAMKEQDTVCRDALVSLIGDWETINKGPNGPMDDPKTVALIKKHIEGLQEMRDLGKDPGRSQEQINALTGYLPVQLTHEDIESILAKAIKTGQVNHIGDAMKLMKETYAGQYDGKVAIRIAKSMLE